MAMTNAQLVINVDLLKYLVSTYDGMAERRYHFRFENGYGARIVKHYGSHGSENDLWELSVIKFFGDDTEITDDLIGSLDDEEVNEVLFKIKDLNKEDK